MLKSGQGFLCGLQRIKCKCVEEEVPFGEGGDIYTWSRLLHEGDRECQSVLELGPAVSSSVRQPLPPQETRHGMPAPQSIECGVIPLLWRVHLHVSLYAMCLRSGAPTLRCAQPPGLWGRGCSSLLAKTCQPIEVFGDPRFVHAIQLPPLLCFMGLVRLGLFLSLRHWVFLGSTVRALWAQPTLSPRISRLGLPIFNGFLVSFKICRHITQMLMARGQK